MIEINKIKSPFIYYCQKVIPLAFDESLSYYEVLCHLTAKIKEVIDEQNVEGDAIEELQQKYLLLVDYVDNYFDNLDVQEEINNKLDQMVEDGVFDEIINQEIFGELNEKVNANSDNITALQNLTENLPTDEQNISNLNEFNEYTNKPLQYGKINLPSEFNDIKFNLYRDIEGKIYDDLDLSSYNTNNIVYVDFDNGDDSTGSGASPFKTIKGALTYINTLAGNNYKIICKTYRFSRNEFWNEQQANEEYTMQKSIVIEPEDPTKRILVSTDQRNLTWTNLGGGVWQTSRSSVKNVYNLQKQNGFGMYEKFTKVNSLEDCQGTLKTWYQSGSNLYVHSNEEPVYDKYLITLSLPIISFNIHNNRFLRLKNIDFYPARRIMFQNNSSDYENSLICENVRIFGSIDYNGFSTDNIKNVYIINCVTGDNFRDGFNYHYTNTPSNVMQNAIIYEVNSISFNNGFEDVNETNNCSTVHEHARIIRCNNIYQNSKTRCIADIESPRVLMINCTINQETQNYRGIEFQDQVAGSGEGIAYLIDCKCLINRTLNIEGTDNFRVRLKNFKGNYKNSNLDIQLYTE